MGHRQAGAPEPLRGTHGLKCSTGADSCTCWGRGGRGAGEGARPRLHESVRSEVRDQRQGGGPYSLKGHDMTSGKPLLSKSQFSCLIIIKATYCMQSRGMTRAICHSPEQASRGERANLPLPVPNARQPRKVCTQVCLLGQLFVLMKERRNLSTS